MTARVRGVWRLTGAKYPEFRRGASPADPLREPTIIDGSMGLLEASVRELFGHEAAASLAQASVPSPVTPSVGFALCDTTLFADQWVKGRSVRLGKVVCSGYCPVGRVVSFRRAPRVWNRVTRGSPCWAAA